MLIVRLLNFLRGSVEFTAKGGFIERFLNLLSSNKIPVWDIVHRKNRITAVTTIDGYKQMRKYARLAGLDLEIKNKNGMPFFMHRYKHRIFFPLCIVVFIFVFAFLSQFVWSINVKGNTSVPSEDIINYYNQIGLKIGSKISSIDSEEMSEEALKLIDGISWSSVNIRGCMATIQVKEKIVVPDITQDTSPSNIVAKSSGQILKLENYAGSSIVAVGDAVQKGDVLVSGAVQNKDGSVTFHHAQAYVCARTSHKVETTTQRKITVRQYLKPKNKYYLYFFNIKIPLNYVGGIKGKYDKAHSNNFMVINNIKMPIGIITERYLRYTVCEKMMDSNFSELLSYSNFCKTINKNMNNMQIEKNTITVNRYKNNIIFNGKFTCIENISTQSPLNVGNTKE